MESIINDIEVTDERTGIKYFARGVLNNNKKELLKTLRKRMDYDYFKTLSPKERAKKKKHSLNFTCPYCLTKENVTSRKQKLTSGFLFWTEDYLVDIFKCGRCGKEFSEDELQREINRFKRENYIIENFENWRDAKKKGENPPEFYSLDKADEMIITDFKHHPIRESK